MSQASTTKRKASKAGRCLTDTGSGTQQITDTNSLARGRWKLEQSVLADWGAGGEMSDEGNKMNVGQKTVCSWSERRNIRRQGDLGKWKCGWREGWRPKELGWSWSGLCVNSLKYFYITFCQDLLLLCHVKNLTLLVIWKGDNSLYVPHT